MATEAKKKKPENISKKEAKKEVFDRLSSALSDIKTDSVSERKFKKRLQKATKLFVPYLVKKKKAK